MRISDWSSDVCSYDLSSGVEKAARNSPLSHDPASSISAAWSGSASPCWMKIKMGFRPRASRYSSWVADSPDACLTPYRVPRTSTTRSEEHTSELQSLMRISYAVFCLKKKNNTKTHK